MRIISVCADDRRSQTIESEGMTSSMTTSDRDRLMSRSPNLNTFDNLTDKKYEKHLTVVVNPARFHRNMTSKSARNIERSGDRSVTASGSASGNSLGSVNGYTLRSWQSCEDNKSTPDLSKGHAAPTPASAHVPPGTTKRPKKTLRDKLAKGFCFVGWLLCCPCCIVGFVLREPPETDADLATDPCWPFSS